MVNNQRKLASGFKLSTSDLSRYPEILQIIDESNYRIVRLHRNLLDIYLSYKLAVANDAWTSDEAGRGVSTVETTVSELKNLFELHEASDNRLRAATSHFLSLDLNYSELLRPEGHMAVCRFLDLDERPLIPGSVRQHPGPQSEKLKNYEELKKLFAETRWAGQFTD